MHSLKQLDSSLHRSIAAAWTGILSAIYQEWRYLMVSLHGFGWSDFAHSTITVLVWSLFSFQSAT